MGFIFTNPGLDPMPQGAGLFTVPAKTTQQDYYTLTRDFMFNGVVYYSNQTEIGDHIKLQIEYTTDGGTTWKRLKKFSDNWYVAPKTEREVILFPSHPVAGMRILFEYTNASTTEIKYTVNLYTFADFVDVNPMAGEEGMNW